MKKIVSILCIAAMLTAIIAPESAAAKDTKAPVITKTNPIDCATDIMTEDGITIRFSEPIKKGKSIAKISLKESDLIAVGFTYEISGNLLEIIPKADLKYDTIYTVTIPSAAVKDVAGNNFAKSFTLTFITEVDPKKAAGTQTEQNGLKYRMEIEAVFDSELTDTKIAYFTELLKMFGIDAKFLDVYKANQAVEKATTGDKTGNTDIKGDTSNYTSYILILKDPGPDKAQVIKVISKTTSVSLSEAKKMADGAPVILQINLTKEQADAAKQQFEALKAEVSILGIE